MSDPTKKPSITIEEFREVCKLTVELTRLRQNECKHLCVENFAADLLPRLLDAVTMERHHEFDLTSALERERFINRFVGQGT